MKKLNGRFVLAIGIAAILTGCGARSNNGTVKVEIDMGGSSRKSVPNAFFLVGPTDVSAFDCYVVNVYGPQISATDNSIVTPACSYPGITSTLIPPTQTAVSLQLPSGPSRTFQMLGVQTGSGCSANTLDGLKAAGVNFQLYTLGQTTVDLFSDTQLSIQDTYVGSNAISPFTCPLGSAAGVQLSLVAGVKGTNATISSIAPAPLLPVSSSFSFTPTLITAATLSTLSSTSNSTAVMVDLFGNANHQAPRIDFVFSLDGFALANYSKVRIVALMGGGNYPALTNPGASISVWQGSSWSASTISNAASAFPTPPSPSSSSFTQVDQTLSISPSNAVVASSSLISPYGTLPSNQNLYVTVMGNSNPTSGDTNVGVLYIQAYLVP